MTSNDVVKLQKKLADIYNYKPIPPMFAQEYHSIYKNTIPKIFNLNGEDNISLYTQKGTLIANGYTRIVIGDYGAFMEISKDQIVQDSIIMKQRQEYRLNDPRYAKNVKYIWLTVLDDSFCKIYHQKQGVDYADYKPNFFYISPFEVSINNNF